MLYCILPKSWHAIPHGLGMQAGHLCMQQWHLSGIANCGNNVRYQWKPDTFLDTLDNWVGSLHLTNLKKVIIARLVSVGAISGTLRLGPLG